MDNQSERVQGWVRTSVRWSRRHKSIVASAVLAISLASTLLLGSLWTANKERQLRKAADEAKNRAESSERQVLVEAERARAHWRSIASTSKSLWTASTGSPHGLQSNHKTQSELDYNLEIQQATADIYATYLSTLPAPEQWTLDEAYAVTFYIKYMKALGKADVVGPWLERIQNVATRLEKQGPDSPKMRDFWRQHYYNIQIDT